MDVVALTRQLVDIPSVTGDEGGVGKTVAEILRSLGAAVEMREVEPGRSNVVAVFGERPTVTLSTHLDTVPPFIPSSEDGANIYGRGSCDAKGILASMIVAAEGLADSGISNFGMLAVVGEERGSAGAIAAAKDSLASKYLINGEPTQNCLALGSKGALRIRLRAMGKAAHSAYPELGDSSINKLLKALANIDALNLPSDKVLGDTTVNIGTIAGGTAPNIVPDSAVAELLIRLVSDPDAVIAKIREACDGLAEAEETLRIPALWMKGLPGYETTVVRYTSDVPILCPAWGEGLLIGPGNIHVAHTEREFISKSDLHEAVGLYQRLVKDLLAA